MVTYTNKKDLQVSFYVSDEKAKKLKEISQKQNRSVSNFVYCKVFDSDFQKQIIQEEMEEKKLLNQLEGVN